MHWSRLRAALLRNVLGTLGISYQWRHIGPRFHVHNAAFHAKESIDYCRFYVLITKRPLNQDRFYDSDWDFWNGDKSGSLSEAIWSNLWNNGWNVSCYSGYGDRGEIPLDIIRCACRDGIRRAWNLLQTWNIISCKNISLNSQYYLNIMER